MREPSGEEQEESVSDRKKRLQREATRRYRERHPEKSRESSLKSNATQRSAELRRLRQRKHHLQIRLRAIEELGGKCLHCNQSFHHSAMDFHHVDPKTKATSGKGIEAGNSWERVQIELAKTILLCANCHRIHHYKERNLDEELS